MSGLGGRGPNMSRYLTDLNTVSPPDSARPADFDEEFFQAFANDFVDLDTIVDPFTSIAQTDFETKPSSIVDNSIGFEHPQSSPDFLNSDFSFTDFSNYPPVGSAAPGSVQGVPGQPSPYPLVSPLSASVSPSTTRSGEKRKLGEVTDPKLAAEEAARLAAEEDKRRRNTAASARFRIKKKQREQALEKTAKEMTEKASTLETKVQQLEMENKWLKSLITEKNDGKNDLQELYDKFARDNSSAACKSINGEARTDGVGTTTKKLKAERA